LRPSAFIRFPPAGDAGRSANQPVDEFPFTNADWGRVKDAACSIVNAQLADDDALADSMFLDLQATLHDLRGTYGDHPILLETEADFCDDTEESIRLYADALSIASENDLPTGSICLSYARLLIENQRDIAKAQMLLESCRESIHVDADSTAIGEYEELTSMLASMTVQ